VRVLTLVKHYLPGYKSGGPIRSLANLVERLGDEFDFTIVAYDRDSGDARPYPGAASNTVHRIGKAEVVYLDAARRHFRNLARVITACRPDVLYINSFFQSQFGATPIILRYLGLLPDVPVILAPRGEFCVGALGLKAAKKRAYLALARALGMHRDITWQASSSFEAAEIHQQIARRGGGRPPTAPRDAVLVVPVVPDLLPATPAPRRRDGHAKVAGHLRAMFLSRIAPKKNLLGALHMLAAVRGSVELTIYGPIEDPRYWSKCQDAIGTLPANIRVRYAGPVEHAQVADAMARHDLFFFPTLGENYGHVIVEAMMAGCLVLLSDRTPWRNLTAAGVGWDLPLEQPERFGAVLDECIAMDGPTFAAWSERATAFALHQATDPGTVEANRQLFRGVIRPRVVQGAAGAALRSRYDEGLR
jgi:glycosyltransferase involved in cell wall biosynthesis